MLGTPTGKGSIMPQDLPITQEGFDKLVKEIENLKKVERLVHDQSLVHLLEQLIYNPFF